MKRLIWEAFSSDITQRILNARAFPIVATMIITTATMFVAGAFSWPLFGYCLIVVAIMDYIEFRRK